MHSKDIRNVLSIAKLVHSIDDVLWLIQTHKNMEIEWRHWLMDFEYLISTPKFVYSQSDPDPEFIFSSIFLTKSLMDNGF